MNYDLALELKNAGFPQKERERVQENLYFLPNRTEVILVMDEHHPTPEMVKNPTLSELIEACGEDFISLIKDQTGWLAHGEDEPLEPMETVGPTPEEAVARLWLALNKKP